MGEVIPMNTAGYQGGTRSRRGPSLNQVILCGRLAADPRVHATPDGLHVSELRLVTNDQPEPEFHDVVSYQRLAELVAE